MDKYFGLNKANQIASTSIEYDIKIKPKQKNKREVRLGLAIRCAICLILILICAVGKYFVIQPLNQASAFLKQELNKDYTTIILELIEPNEE